LMVHRKKFLRLFRPAYDKIGSGPDRS
jgi:hypothetical protein